MSYLYNQTRKSSYGYKVIEAPAELPIDLCQLKRDHLFLSPEPNDRDSYLTLLIEAAASVAEALTRRELITKKFKCYLDVFPNAAIKILRSKLQSVDSIKYYSNGTLLTLPAENYYITDEENFGYIDTAIQISWPYPVDARKQAVEIIFNAGYGEYADDIPSDLRLAMMQHIAKVYENRGDCADMTVTNEGLKFSIQASVPHTCKLIYQKYKILNTDDTNNFVSRDPYWS
jgi:uncharacterized phiE125 gp8 family phage protein